MTNYKHYSITTLALVMILLCYVLLGCSGANSGKREGRKPQITQGTLHMQFHGKAFKNASGKHQAEWVETLEWINREVQRVTTLQPRETTIHVYDTQNNLTWAFSQVGINGISGGQLWQWPSANNLGFLYGFKTTDGDVHIQVDTKRQFSGFACHLVTHKWLTTEDPNHSSTVQPLAEWGVWDPIFRQTMFQLWLSRI